MKTAAQPRTQWAIGAIYVAVGGVFVADLVLPRGEASGLLYVIPVLLTLWLPWWVYTLQVATLSTLLTLLGFFLSPTGSPIWGGVLGRVLALCTSGAMVMLALKRRHTEETLRESEERYRELFENANDAIVTFTLDGIVTSVNRGLEAMLGWSREELIGQHYRKFGPPASVAVGEERTRRFLAGERLPSIFEGEQLRKDGGVVPVEARTRPIRDREGKPVGIQGIYRDITVRKQEEEALRRSAAHFRALVEHALDFVVVLTREGTVRYESPAVARMLGYTPQEREGRTGFEHIHPDDLPRVMQTFTRTIELPGATASLEFRARHKDGSWRTLEAVGTNLLDDPVVAGVVVNYRDITDRKRMEEELRKARDELDQRVQERTAELVHTNAALQGEITMRQQAEAGLRESEARLQAILDNTQALIYLKDLDGRYLLTNRPHQLLTHTTREQVKGKTDYELFPPERATMFRRNDQTVLASGRPLQFEEVAADEGNLHTYLSEKFLLYDTAGGPYAVCGISMDITERKRVEEALQESEARYRLLFERNPHPMWIYDLETLAFLAVNDAAVHHYGYAREEFLAMTIKDIRPPGDVAALLETVSRIPSGFKAPDQWRHRKKDGTFIDVEITSHGLEFAGRQARVILARDITERKRLEVALQQERNLLEVTLASIGDAVIATDATATLTFINPVAETLTGWPVEEALGRHIAEVFPIINEQTRQVVENPAQKVLREGKVVGLANHTVLITRDGREVPIADSGAPIQGHSGQVYGTVMVFRDITESKHAEAALIRAKEAAEAADRTKSEFLATMSHELRTPLNVILGYTDMLIDGGVGELPAAQVDILRRIDRNSRVLFELISMVLDLNRLEAGRLPVEVKAVRVAQLLAEIKAEMQGLCDQSGLACGWQVAPGLPLLYTDPGKLKVVIKNLLSNAVKFTKEGGITVEAQEQRGGVEISVSDTGIGIPPDALSFIFEPFRQVDSSDTRPYSGSGLGLHIVQRLLEVLGGTITVESAVGKGSTFRVWVPLHGVKQ